MKRRQSEAGYTLIEILAVLTLLAVLMLLVAPNIMKGLMEGKIKATKNQISATSSVLNSYFMDNGCYPSTEQGLKALVEKPSLPPVPDSWNGPYVSAKEVPKDAWNHELHYVCPGVHNTDSYDLYSYGPDNQEGGSGYNVDIGNWQAIK